MNQMMKKVACIMLAILLMLSVLSESVVAKQNGKSKVNENNGGINQQLKENISSFQFIDDEVIAIQYDEKAVEFFEEAVKTMPSDAKVASITDFEEDWEDEYGDFDDFFKSNSFQELIIEYKSILSKEYFYGTLLRSDQLPILKHKLTILTKASILSIETSDVTKELLMNALYNMLQADIVVCKNSITNLSYFIETINHKGTKNSINAELKNAIKEYDKAEGFLKKGLVIPASKAYQKSYKNVLLGFEKGEIYFTDEHLSWDTDSDQDGVIDLIEYCLSTNPFTMDTDSDGLSDYDELHYGFNPLNPDSDGDGILDIEEDLDGDGLSIGKEHLLATYPLNPDTDEDGLSDGDEVKTYFTDPLNPDTDGDGLNDGDEIELGLNPLVSDTDGNGIQDSQEKILQTLSSNIDESEKPEVIGVSVTMEGTGNLKTNTTIESVYGVDMLTSDVVGLIGAPIEINSNSQFDDATITFYYDDTLLGETKEEDLAVMRYDEENNRYELFDEESIINIENNTVSYTTTHFSTYLVVDKNKWYDTWRNAISYGGPSSPGIPASSFDFSYVLDNSGSMAGSKLATAKQAITSFIEAMRSNDRGSIVSFNSEGRVVKSFTGDTTELKMTLYGVNASGGTNVNDGLLKSIQLFEDDQSTNSNIIILLCDGDVNVTGATIQRAKNKQIKIFTVLVGSTSGTVALQNIADQTGGKFYYAATAEEIIDAFYGLNEDIIGEIDTTDTDGDGLYDIYEISGMMIPNGKVIRSDPTKADTDGDGLSDGVEMGEMVRYTSYIGGKEVKQQYFTYKSDPIKEDTDGDGLLDGKARKINGKKVTPKDPDNFKKNGPVGIWQTQYELELKGEVQTSYIDPSQFPEFNPKINQALAERIVDIALSCKEPVLEYEEELRTILMLIKSFSEGSTEIGAYLLNFVYDEDKKAYHSQVDTWQRVFGYNKLYDEAFRIGSNMAVDRLEFLVNNHEYVLWVWKGDYWNLQSGAEMGLYIYNENSYPNTNGHTDKHYDCIDFELPMTLSLYNYYSKDSIKNLFNWAPDENQWWITGFNPEHTEPDPNVMVSIGTIDFTGREEMYDALKSAAERNLNLKDYFIFDEDGHTAWIIWYKGVMIQ